MKNQHTILLFLVLAILISAPIEANSCGNEYEEDFTELNGNYKKNRVYDYYTYYYFEQGFEKQQLLDKKSRLETKLREKPSFKTSSDYALVLLKLGEYKKGLVLLEDLVKRYPNEYNIVVNLGTAYELNGKPELALKYITKAVKINPASHEGSEWIHIEILKSMLKLRKNKTYLKEQSVLNLNFPHDLSSYQTTLTKKDNMRLDSIKEQLRWQLKERVSFVVPPNAVVADLLFDLGNLVALTESIERSIPLYDQSLQYMPDNFNAVLNRRDELKEKMYWNRFKKKKYLILFAGLSIFASLFLVNRWRKKRAKARAAEIAL
jgi:tetratricopeptide (TPR) repeat protein